MNYSQVNEDCSICLENIKTHEKCSMFPCKHNFCYTCIYGWLKNSKTCPNDRTLITHVQFIDPQSSNLLKLQINQFITYDDKIKMYKLIKEMKDFINFLIENIETQCKSNYEFIKRFINEKCKINFENITKLDIKKVSSEWKNQYFEVVNYQYLWSEINDQYNEILDKVNEFLKNSWELKLSNDELVNLKEIMNSLFNVSKRNQSDIGNVFACWKIEDVILQHKTEKKIFNNYLRKYDAMKNKDSRMPEKIYSMIDWTSYSISKLLRSISYKYEMFSDKVYLEDVKHKCYNWSENIKKSIII